MTRTYSQANLGGVRPPVRRVLALDGGSRRFRLLLAETDFGRFRILKQEMFDVQAEGLVSADEIKGHLQGLMSQWGNPPLALSLPQHLSISQVIDLPATPEKEVEQLIADETVKLSGVTESRIVYDFVRTASQSDTRQQFWVSLCQESDIRERIARMGLEQEEICEVTTNANALIASYRAAAPDSSRAILVHLGAQTTVVAILLDGQGTFATSFQMGGDFFTRSLARLTNSSPEIAERMKREKDLLNGSQDTHEFAGVVDGWVAELKRQLNEWFQANPALVAQVATFQLVASGSAFDQPGLLKYLEASAGLVFKAWPPGKPELAGARKGFEIALGTALQALGYSAQPVSLLPEDYRLNWRKRLVRQRIELASLALLVVCAVLLGFGSWRKLSLIKTKEALLAKVRAGQRAFDENAALTDDLVSEYENLRPLFAAQQNTMDTLKTLALLQQSRSNHSFWYVLIADQQSYFTMPPALLSTNRPAKTNLIGAALEAAQSAPFVLRSSSASLTNTAPAKPGLIAELCVPGDAETARQVLSEIVNGLKQQLLFSKVDLLSDDLRRSLADPKVTVTDRFFALSLDFAQTDFQQPVRLKPPPGPGNGKGNKRPNHPTWPAGGTDPGGSQPMP
ncbi:MAG TPA: pilus assembly protein PilM [Verrucomicrobiae bacterium]|nr:pilus assembly protein PilM [Verrucomicrobiae bacterium]